MTAFPVVVFVTDPSRGLERTCAVVEAAAKALGPGRLAVQLRDKEDRARRAAWGPVLRAVTHRARASLVVNGDVDLTLVTGADGVHVPVDGIHDARRRLGPAALVTTPAHADDDVRRAREGGASAALVSPIHPTPGKAPARGTTALTSARAIAGSQLAVIALGGIDPRCVAACAAAGADGVAVIRALYESSDPGAIASALAAPWARGL
ncbi:MAG: thiamine phosphate synthase [Deltaproteobacteria bacterium]|nr:thiamine phosphate synthase [Deltaproteobacteria bacterium]